MKAVILAGGLGTRLRPFTEAIPKPLLPIGEKAVLEIQIERFKKYGFKEIYVATNYKSEYIEAFLGDGRRFGVKLFVSKENKPLGTAGPLSLIKKNLNKPFVVMNGDILTLIDFSKIYEFAMEKGTKLTVAIKREVFPFHFGNIYSKGDFVTRIVEKPNLVTKILAGIYVMTPGIFEYVRHNQPLGIDSLIKTMLARRDPIAKYEMTEYWLDIGRIEDYEKAQNIYESHFK
ncbi:MAG: sugar phosphate nucleotidyltransferase [Thermodesulfobacteriota bacterium]